MLLVREIVIPEFLTHALLSKSRREKYKEIDGVMHHINPESAGTPSYKKINGQLIWQYGTNGNFQITKMVSQMKDQIMEVLKDIEPINKFPIIIRGEMHTVFNQHIFKYRNGELIRPKDNKETVNVWDIGNLGYIWSKVFDDCLKPYNPPKRGKLTKENTKYSWWKGLIPDDNINYVIETGSMRFVPINNYDERKLVFKIYYDVE